MTTPAQKCAERIVKDLYAFRRFDTIAAREGAITAIIQSEYAETFKVAREAMDKAITTIEALQKRVVLQRLSEETIHQLRTALELMPK